MFLYFFVLCTACILWLYTLIYWVAVLHITIIIYLLIESVGTILLMVGGAWDRGGGEVYLYHPLCIVLEDMRLKMNYDCMPGPLWVSISNLILADIAGIWCHPWHSDTPTHCQCTKQCGCLTQVNNLNTSVHFGKHYSNKPKAHVNAKLVSHLNCVNNCVYFLSCGRI